MDSFHTYLIGFIIFIVGIAIAAYLLGAPPMWIAVGLIILIGIGIISASSRRPGDVDRR
jgi:hypothetical protein